MARLQFVTFYEVGNSRLVEVNSCPRGQAYYRILEITQRGGLVITP